MEGWRLISPEYSPISVERCLTLSSMGPTAEAHWYRQERRLLSSASATARYDGEGREANGGVAAAKVSHRGALPVSARLKLIDDDRYDDNNAAHFRNAPPAHPNHQEALEEDDTRSCGLLMQFDDPCPAEDLIQPCHASYSAALPRDREQPRRSEEVENQHCQRVHSHAK